MPIPGHYKERLKWGGGGTFIGGGQLHLLITGRRACYGEGQAGLQVEGWEGAHDWLLLCLLARKCATSISKGTEYGDVCSPPAPPADVHN